ncbi:DnaJ family domain-containing protein [Brachybacterium epidermidis]|uniref:DnaJ family domain-containing protein n=1 Tax=Brachybacterium epidermidis TaxID=2781983 RepID=UPI00398ECCCC
MTSGDPFRREDPDPFRPEDPDPFRPEDPVDAAIARGDFDDLALAGKPLRLPSRHDPDWWIKQRIDEEDVDRDALLPVVMLLRREYERREETLAVLPTELEVREYAEDYTRRVRDDRLRSPMARMLAPEMDPEEAVARWRELRAGGAEDDAQADAGGSAGDTGDSGDPHGPHRLHSRPRWWPFGLGRRRE